MSDQGSIGIKTVLSFIYLILTGLIAKRPVEATDETTGRVRLLAERWAMARCSSPQFVQYDCKSSGLNCRHIILERRHCFYFFGPLGWSGSEALDGAEYDFLGFRYDVLHRYSKTRLDRVVAHEMAHERQQFCQLVNSDTEYAIHTMSVYQCELEAEKESMTAHPRHGCSRAAAWLARLIRTPIATLLQLPHSLGVFVLIGMIVGLVVFLEFGLNASKWSYLEHVCTFVAFACIAYFIRTVIITLDLAVLCINVNNRDRHA